MNYSRKESELNDVVMHLLKKFLMCITVIEYLMPLNQTARIKMYRSNTQSRLFCGIAKSAIWFKLCLIRVSLFLGTDFNGLVEIHLIVEKRCISF